MKTNNTGSLVKKIEKARRKNQNITLNDNNDSLCKVRNNIRK